MTAGHSNDCPCDLLGAVRRHVMPRQPELLLSAVILLLLSPFFRLFSTYFVFVIFHV